MAKSKEELFGALLDNELAPALRKIRELAHTNGYRMLIDTLPDGVFEVRFLKDTKPTRTE